MPKLRGSSRALFAPEGFVMPNLTAEIKGGRILPDTNAGLVALSKLEGKRVTLEVEVWRKSRSAQQNRYFHGVVLEILSQDLGYYKDEMRAALCHKFLSDVDPKNGLMRIKGTSDLNTVEFEEFMARVRQWAGEDLRIAIPLPNEYDVSEMKKEQAA